MKPEQVRIGMPVDARCWSGPFSQRGTIVRRREDTDGGRPVWQVRFPSGTTFLLTADKMEYPSAVDLLALLSEG